MSNKLAIQELAQQLGLQLQAKAWRMTTAESCTGGLIAAALTDVAGASQWFDGAVVCYANSVKMRLLGVQSETLLRHGAVSEACVREMALGARDALGVEVAVAVSGIAGPGGGTADKPVGTVWLAWAAPQSVVTRVLHLPGDRGAVRQAAVLAALKGLIEISK